MPKTIRVVLADDVKNFRRIIADLLRDEGLDVIEAADGDALHTAALTESPVVITDLRLAGRPRFDGLRALRSAKLACPAILITGWLDDDTRRDARELGIEHMLEKPFTLESLLAAIRALTADAPR